jgi:hypothetical protein
VRTHDANQQPVDSVIIYLQCPLHLALFPAGGPFLPSLYVNIFTVSSHTMMTSCMSSTNGCRLQKGQCNTRAAGDVSMAVHLQRFQRGRKHTAASLASSREQRMESRAAAGSCSSRGLPWQIIAARNGTASATNVHSTRTSLLPLICRSEDVPSVSHFFVFSRVTSGCLPGHA